MTIVVDASAVTELLVVSDPARRTSIVDAIGDDAHWIAPEHLLVEVVSALRGRWLGGHLSKTDFERAVAAIARFEFDVWPTPPLLPRMVELAANASAYDAAYLALAEELGCHLVTADRKLATVPGIRCRVVGWADG